MWKLHRNDPLAKKTRTLWSKCCGPNRSNSQESTGQNFPENWSNSTSKAGKALLNVAAWNVKPWSILQTGNVRTHKHLRISSLCCEVQPQFAPSESQWYCDTVSHKSKEHAVQVSPCFTHLWIRFQAIPGLCHPGQIHCETFKIELDMNRTRGAE